MIIRTQLLCFMSLERKVRAEEGRADMNEDENKKLRLQKDQFADLLEENTENAIQIGKLTQERDHYREMVENNAGTNKSITESHIKSLP